MSEAIFLTTRASNFVRPKNPQDDTTICEAGKTHIKSEQARFIGGIIKHKILKKEPLGGQERCHWERWGEDGASCDHLSEQQWDILELIDFGKRQELS